jgi:hypothetical protein
MYLMNVSLEPSHRSQGLIFESTRHLVAMVEPLSITNNIQESYCTLVMIAFGYIPNWLVPGRPRYRPNIYLVVNGHRQQNTIMKSMNWPSSRSD